MQHPREKHSCNNEYSSPNGHIVPAVRQRYSRAIASSAAGTGGAADKGNRNGAGQHRAVGGEVSKNGGLVLQPPKYQTTRATLWDDGTSTTFTENLRPGTVQASEHWYTVWLKCLRIREELGTGISSCHHWHFLLFFKYFLVGLEALFTSVTESKLLVLDDGETIFNGADSHDPSIARRR